MALVNPKTGDVVSFQLVQNSINGDERVDVQVGNGAMKYQIAKLIDPQLDVKHANLYPYFKDSVGNINDASAYDYITVVGRNGTPEVIGIPWILTSTYRITEGRPTTVVITNWREDWRAPTISFLAGLGATYKITTEEL